MYLYDHQKRILERNPDKHLLCWDTGTGKTIAMLALAYGKEVGPPLVVCPKPLKKKWERDSSAFLKERGKEEMIKMGTSIVRMPKIVSKEEFRRDWDTLKGYKVVIVDEGHHFAGVRSKTRSQLFEAMMRYLRKHDVPHIFIGTATAYLSTPWNLYAIAMLLGYQWSRINFEKKFFVERFIGRHDKDVAGKRHARSIMVPKEDIKEDMARIVNKIGSTIRLDECADVPEQVFLNELFDLTKEQERGMDNVNAVEQNPVVRYGKHHQVANGCLKGDDFAPHQHFSADKHERICELSDEYKKMAVICRYTLQIETIKKMLMAKGKRVLVIQGGVKDYDTIIQEAEAIDECVVLINAMVSEGYELPSIATWVFASLSNSYKDYKQMLGRGLRINRLKKNLYIHLITAGGIDEAWYESIMNKRDFNIEIYSEKYRILDGTRPTLSHNDQERGQIPNNLQPLA